MRRAAVLIAALTALSLTGCGGDSGRHDAGPPLASGQTGAGTASTPAAASTTAAPAPAPRRRAHHPRHRAAVAPAPGARPSSPQTTSGGAPVPSPKAGRSGRRRARKRPVAPPASGAESISLTLHGGVSATVEVCGAPHHSRLYSAGTTVAFSGAVGFVPQTTWKVKIKLKLCRGGTFVDFAKFDAVRDKHHGTFSGTFPAPAAGDYEARAELYVADRDVAKSLHRHFVTH